MSTLVLLLQIKGSFFIFHSFRVTFLLPLQRILRVSPSYGNSGNPLSPKSDQPQISPHNTESREERGSSRLNT